MCEGGRAISLIVVGGVGYQVADLIDLLALVASFVDSFIEIRRDPRYGDRCRVSLSYN